MAKVFAKGFYNSKQWKKARKMFVAYRVGVDGGLCQHCKEELGYIVDHKIEISEDNIEDPLITLDESNFQYLCHACHNKKTFGSQETPKYTFDDSGMPMPIAPP